MCSFGHISVVSVLGTQGTLLVTESPSSSELVSSPSGRGGQGSLAHPACLDYRSRYPKALFW
ncbi:MAG: hypothetical protein ACK55Z_26615 [bacterium]